MARIPEFQQRQLASSVTPSTISDAGAGFRALGQAAGDVANVFGQIREQRIATESAKFNSGLEVQAEQIFTDLSQNEEIKRDPAQFRPKILERFQQLRNSPEFLQQPRPIQRNAISRLQSLETQFLRRSVRFEASQNLQNNINNLDQTQNNYEQLASSSDAPVDELLTAFTKDILPFVRALGDTAKGEEIQRQGSKAIVEQRVNRLIEQSSFDNARTLLDENQLGDFFTAKERIKLRSTIDRNERRVLLAQQKQASRQAAIKTVSDALESGTPIDAKDRQNQNILNEFYQDSGINQGLATQDIGAANQLVDIAVKTNFIPALAESTIRAQLTTGSSEQKQFAADMISRLQEVAPRTLDNFARRDLEQANLAVSYIRSGVAPSKAFDFAKEQTDLTNKPLVDARKAGLNAVVKKQDFAAQAADALDPGFFTIGPDLPDAPIARDSIIADYRNIFEGFMLSTGDAEAAKNLTKQEFTRLYGQSEVTGNRRVMKYPPENFYSVPGLDNEWMEEQLQEDVSEAIGREVDLDDVVIIADAITAREAQPNGRPSYQIFIKQDLGDFQEVRNENGDLLRFRFDSADVIERERRKLQEEQAEDISSAKAARENRLLEESLFSPDERAESIIRPIRGF